jgi:hypothetical protein
MSWSLLLDVPHGPVELLEGRVEGLDASLQVRDGLAHAPLLGLDDLLDVGRDGLDVREDLLHLGARLARDPLHVLDGLLDERRVLLEDLVEVVRDVLQIVDDAGQLLLALRCPEHLGHARGDDLDVLRDVVDPRRHRLHLGALLDDEDPAARRDHLAVRGPRREREVVLARDDGGAALGDNGVLVERVLARYLDVDPRLAAAQLDGRDRPHLDARHLDVGLLDEPGGVLEKGVVGAGLLAVLLRKVDQAQVDRHADHRGEKADGDGISPDFPHEDPIFSYTTPIV